MAQTLNIAVDQGSDYEQILTFKDSAGAPINITGWTFAGQARTSIEAVTASVVFAFTLLAQSGLTLGQVVWTVPSGQTEPLGTSPITLFYDVERIDATAKKLRILQGTMTISPEITR